MNGGNGGQGGAANADILTASLINQASAHASATGGSGGEVNNGSNSQAGHGGNAAATVSASSTVAWWWVDTRAESAAQGGSGGSSTLNLDFYFNLVAANNSGYDFNFIVGNATAPAVPIPGTVMLLGSGLVVLVFLKQNVHGLTRSLITLRGRATRPCLFWFVKPAQQLGGVSPLPARQGKLLGFD